MSDGLKSVILIGGGIGGLSCAIRLAGAGVKVCIVEQQATLGGKLQRVQRAGYTFDRGPSTITMLDSFARIFKSVGRQIEDYVHFYPIQPLTRNFFADGSRLDLTTDLEQMRAQIASYSSHDAGQYPAFMKEARKLYQISKDQFLQKMMLSWKDKLNPALVRSFLKIRPLTTLDQLLRKYFRHPNTLAMFGRYATYVGSSPYQAPAIFAMMASLEAEEGIYGVYGGTYEMVCGLEKLARELGVEIHTSTKVDQIQVKDGRAQSVLCGQKEFQADVVVANADALTVYSQLLTQEVRPSMSDRKIGQYEPSHSGFVVLAGVAQRFPQLLHHNVFFPSKYRHEFEQLFHSREVLTEPTLYICYNGLDEQEMAPPGCSNLFILANAPSLGSVDWSAIQDVYAQQLLSMLESYGLSGIKQSLEVCETFTPLDLQQAMGAHQGAIYGISSNRPSQTFFRPANRAKDIDNLWFVGGTTHPGGGTPIVALSGQLVAERLLVEYR